jgi:hypothetical protein
MRSSVLLRYDSLQIEGKRGGQTVESGQSQAGRRREMRACIVALIAASALMLAPACANAASPVLEFASPGNGFPIAFTAEGGEVTAELNGFATVVHCTGSEGEGEITGPRSTVSNYVFTGCKTESGDHKCQSQGANEEEITAPMIEADLVFIDQAKHEVGMLLNPGGGVYMDFECGGELVEASGPFLSPVGPINQEVMSFTASLSHLGATQTPSEYEGPNGEKLQAIPMGKRESQPLPATTGVGLSFTILPSVPLEIKAITAAEVEAKQRGEEEAAAKKRQEEEAATAARKRQEEQQARAKRLALLRSKALAQCRRKAHSKHKRMRCERRVKKKYRPAAQSS